MHLLVWAFLPVSVWKVSEGVSVPWSWICRETNLGLRGPSGDEPLTQRLMSVKSGSDDSVKLQPRLSPPSITMYFGHSAVTLSPLCLSEPRPPSECRTDVQASSVPYERFGFCVEVCDLEETTSLTACSASSSKGQTGPGFIFNWPRISPPQKNL